MKCARCQEIKNTVLVETGFSGEKEPLCGLCVGIMLGQCHNLMEKAKTKLDSAWLVERAGNHGPEWLYVEDWFCFGWTADSLKAIRFFRRDDAQQMLVMLENEDCKATEHQWG